MAKALPELLGKLTGSSIRVPTPDVSLAILNLSLEHGTTKDEVNDYLREMSLHSVMRKQIDYIDSPEVVSTDFVGSRRAGIVDGLATISNDKNLVLYVWYDNEFGYSCQVVRVMEEMAGVNPPTFPAKDSVKDAAPGAGRRHRLTARFSTPCRAAALRSPLPSPPPRQRVALFPLELPGRLPPGIGRERGPDRVMEHDATLQHETTLAEHALDVARANQKKAQQLFDDARAAHAAGEVGERPGGPTGTPARPRQRGPSARDAGTIACSSLPGLFLHSAPFRNTVDIGPDVGGPA